MLFTFFCVWICVSASRYSCRLTEYQITQTPSPQLSERANEGGSVSARDSVSFARIHNCFRWKIAFRATNPFCVAHQSNQVHYICQLRNAPAFHETIMLHTLRHNIWNLMSNTTRNSIEYFESDIFCLHVFNWINMCLLVVIIIIIIINFRRRRHRHCCCVCGPISHALCAYWMECVVYSHHRSHPI